MATKPTLKSVDKQDEAAKATEENTPPPKKKSKKILILLILLILLGGGGGAAWYFLGHKEAEHGKPGEKKAEVKASVYVPLEIFTVNLQGDGSGADHFLQIGIVLQVADNETVEAIKQQMPMIRNRLLLLLSGKTPADLSTMEGKKKLSSEILSETRQSLPAEKSENKDVQSVLFASLIIQ